MWGRGTGPVVGKIADEEEKESETGRRGRGDCSDRGRTLDKVVKKESKHTRGRVKQANKQKKRYAERKDHYPGIFMS